MTEKITVNLARFTYMDQEFLILESMALAYFARGTFLIENLEGAKKMQIECPVLEDGRISMDDHLYLITVEEREVYHQKLMFRSDVLDYVYKHAAHIWGLEKIKMITEVPNE